MTDPRAAYAGARLHARYSRRPVGAQWGALDASRTPQHYLDVLRAGRWLHVPEGDLATDADARERWLREAWRAACAEVAGWYDAAWTPAFRWTALLADLDALERLREGDAVPAWVQADDLLGALAQAAASERGARLADTPYAPLEPAWATPEPLLQAWHRVWLDLRPRTDVRTSRVLQELASAVAAASRLGVGARREAVEGAAHRAFRRGAGTAAAGFAYLAIAALQLERVRGGLAARAVPGAEG